MREVILMAAVVAGVLQGPPAGQPAAPPGTDIHLLRLSGGLASMKTAKVTPISTLPGYDNQPCFSPDGSKLLLAANRDGKQIDIWEAELARGRMTPLTQTPENENSPTYLPDGAVAGGGFSVVRTEPDKTQRLWRFDPQGRNPQIVLADVKPVGYHAWIDAGTLALFVLGPPATLQIASVSSGKAEIVAEGIGRSLHRIPGTRLVSFVQRDAGGELLVKQIDSATKKIETLIKAVEGSGNDRDMTWMPDGKTILMSSGTKIFSWTRGETGWTDVFDAASHQLGAVSRIAVSPKGDAVAIVVAEPGK